MSAAGQHAWVTRTYTWPDSGGSVAWFDVFPVSFWADPHVDGRGPNRVYARNRVSRLTIDLVRYGASVKLFKD